MDAKQLLTKTKYIHDDGFTRCEETKNATKGWVKKKNKIRLYFFYTRKPVFLCDVECVCTQSIGWD